MKKILAVAVAVAVTAAVYVGSRLWAQPNTAPAVAAPQVTRVAFINIAKVFQDYKKAKDYEKELDTLIGPRRLQRETLAKEMIQRKTELQKPNITPKDKETHERELLKLQR